MQKTMFRVIKDKENPYVMLNKTFLNDSNLSLKSKGLLAYLMSMPDDWQIYENEIVKHHTDGKDSLSSAIRELINNGYITRQRMRDEKGRLKAYEYRVYEAPIHIGKSSAGETKTGKPATTNNNLTDNDLTEYKKDNGIFPSGENSHISPYTNKDVIEAMKVYMNDLYMQKTHKKHPFLKPEQYRQVYDKLAAFCSEWGTEYRHLIDMMCDFLNNKTIQSDWNINHFATDGIMLNRMYEVAY
jgi:hypothetical protein